LELCRLEEAEHLQRIPDRPDRQERETTRKNMQYDYNEAVRKLLENMKLKRKHLNAFIKLRKLNCSNDKPGK